MVRPAVTKLTAVLAAAFGITAAGVLLQRGCDGVLRVETWDQELFAAAREAGLQDPYLLAGLVYSESRGNPGAQSSVEAGGLCQLLPSTAAELAGQLGIQGPPYAPRDNLRMGARYLQQQLQRFDGDRDLALLAFRMGPAAVLRNIEQAGGREVWLDTLRRRKPSPWDYRTQVLRFRDRFEERAAAGVGMLQVP